MSKRFPLSSISLRKPGPVPAWLDRNCFRAAMLRQVNTMANGRWGAISTANGIVWFRYSALIAVMRDASNRDPGVLALQVDVEAMNNLVFTVLRSFSDCVVWEMLGRGYTGTRCRVLNYKGEVTEVAYLTPVKASFMNILPSTLERLKPDVVRSVAKIEPVWRKV